MTLHAAATQWPGKMNRLRSAAMAACCIVSLCGVPKTALSLTLMDAYHAVLANDSVYAMARASRDAGLEKLPLARGALLPSVTLSANKARNDLSNRSDDFKSMYNSDGYTVQLVQPLLNRPAWEGYKQGELLAAMGEAQFLADTQDTMLRAAQAYFDVLAATDVLEAQEALASASREQLELTRSSLDAGTVPITDVNEAQSRFDLPSAQVLGARNDLEVKRYALGRLTGSEPDTLAGLRSRLALAAPQPQDMKRWTNAAELENLAVRTKQLGLDYAMR
jgi:outer membrane protein